MSKPLPPPKGPIDSLLLSGGALLAVYVAITTLLVIHAAYLPVPIADSWDHWSLVAQHGGNYLAFLFQQHNEHRIAVPRLFFLMDQAWFAGKGVFLLAANLAIFLLMALVIWSLALRAGTWERKAAAMMGCVLLAATFSGQQFSNLTWPFQIPFALLYCSSAGAVFALTRATAKTRSRWLWVAAACLLGAVATYSMANGVLLWPALLALAFWLPAPRAARAAVAGCGAALTAAYLYGYHSPQHHAEPAAALTEHFGECVLFAAAYLGSPTEALMGALRIRSETALTAGCVGTGLAGIGALGVALVLLARQPKRDGAQAALLCLALFLAASAGIVALGRVNFPISMAWASRYRTPALLFWIALAGFYWALFGARRPRLWLAAALLWIAATAAPQRTWILYARDYARPYLQAEIAIASGVYDEPVWGRLFHTPSLLIEPTRYLRDHRLAVFAEEWAGWLGRPLRAAIPRTHTDCYGEIQLAAAVDGGTQPGYRISGSVPHTRGERPPEMLVLAGEDQRILGFARMVSGRDWTGYVPGLESRRVTAWAVEEDGASACYVGAVQAADKSEFRLSHGAAAH